MHNRVKLLKSLNSRQDKRIKFANFKESQYKFDKKNTGIMKENHKI